MVMKTLTLKGISNLFPNSKITILKHRPKIANIDENIEKGESLKLRVVPFESITAISKIIQGDLKSFAETHIESHVCTNLSTLCRDYPYRIKYSIYIDDEDLSLYSECINIEILMTIVFGDLIKYFDFYEGDRDGITFKYSSIPRSLLSSKVQNLLNSIAGFSKVNIEARNAYKILNYLQQFKEMINEIILIMPCLDNSTVETIENLAKEALQNPLARIFIVVSAPSIYDAKICEVSYKEFFVNYVKLLDLSESLGRLYLCNSEATNTELIVNRSTYLVSYNPRFIDKSEFIVVKDYSYVDNFTLKYLRDCLCSSHIIKSRKYVS